MESAKLATMKKVLLQLGDQPKLKEMHFEYEKIFIELGYSIFN